jgi:hypothetical protein
MSDEELLALAADIVDLTETAQQVLLGEMSYRRLDMPLVAVEAPNPSDPPPLRPWASSVHPDAGAVEASNTGALDEDNLPSEFTWKTTLCECDGPEQALQIRAVLGQAGIESWVEQRGSRYALDMSNLRVLVAADQIDLAREIASRPIPQEIIDQCAEEAPAFETPNCPKCGAEDPVLEGADPVNTWLCEACGAQWTDPVQGMEAVPEPLLR